MAFPVPWPVAASQLIHGGAIARGVADVGGISFGLWDPVMGFAANILAYLLAALAGAADSACAIGSAIDGLWNHATGFFAAPAGGLVLPLEKRWQWLVTVSSGIDDLPLEKLWQWLASSTADAAGAISSGLDELWQLVTRCLPGILAYISAALGGAAHELARQTESLWQHLLTNGAGAIGFDVDGLWHLVTGFFPKIFAALAGAAHELPQKLDELLRWLKAAADAALPFVLGIAAVLLLVALVWFFGCILCAAAVGACKALVYAFCYGVYHVAVAVSAAVAWLLPPCLRFCAVVAMKAPGTAGMVISRAAFVANPALYFQILRTAGSVVAAAVFCTATGARFVAAPVAALFRVLVGA